MYEIRNIKISLKIEEIPLNNVRMELLEKNIEFKIYPNFISFKKHFFSFVIFRPSKNKTTHVNVSNVKNKDGFKECVKTLKNVLKCKVISFKIDNIISTKHIEKTIDLPIISKNQNYNIRYNPEQFPGLFIKFDIGTAIIYHTGNLVVVGCKKFTDIKWIITNVCAIISTL